MIAESNAPCGIDELVPLIRECVSCGKEVKMRVTGVSMTPTLINRRDCVVLAKADKIKKYDIVLHRRESGQYILHRVIAKKGDVLTIAGDFEIEKEYPVYTSQIIARAVAFERKGRLCSCKNPLYKLYSAVWTAIFPYRLRAFVFMRKVRRVLNGKN